jgi:uncharacterized membrane protein
MMAPAGNWARPRLHPLHAILLGFPIALFSAALATDITYLRTAEIQWSNFSAWLIAGALVFGGLVGVWAIVDLLVARRREGGGRALAYVVALALMWILGLINAFQHSRDAWSSVGTTGLVLSILCAVLALAAGWIAYSGAVVREVAR